jgi:hypothetical protein
VTKGEHLERLAEAAHAIVAHALRSMRQRGTVYRPKEKRS